MFFCVLILMVKHLSFIFGFVQGNDFQTQLQLGNNAFYGFNYIQVHCAFVYFVVYIYIFVCIFVSPAKPDITVSNTIIKFYGFPYHAY